MRPARTLPAPSFLVTLALQTLLPTAPLLALPQPPRIFSSDLQSGPVTGGEQNPGLFVTLYGGRLGSARGSSTVTFGGVEVARYVCRGEDVAPRALHRTRRGHLLRRARRRDALVERAAVTK